jgi:hypothetical protein
MGVWVEVIGLMPVRPDVAGIRLGSCPRIGIVARKWRSEAKLAYVRGE